MPINQLLKRRHKRADRCVRCHSAHAVVATGHQTEDLTLCGTVVRNRNRAVAFESLERKHILEGLIRTQIGIAGYKARLVRLDSAHHRRLIFDRL